MDQVEHPLRRQVFIPLIFCLFIMLTASLASIFMIQRLHIINTIKSKVQGIEQLFPTLLNMEARQLEVQLDILKNDQDLQKKWAARDREELFNTAYTGFSKINARYNITTHFYFIDLDRICFLRVHNADRFGDIINRSTMNTTFRKGEPSSGIELGPLGTFTLRVVHPFKIFTQRLEQDLLYLIMNMPEIS